MRRNLLDKNRIFSLLLILCFSLGIYGSGVGEPDNTPPVTKKWEFTTGGLVSSSPAIGSDGTIYVGSDDNKLYAIRSDSLGLADSPWPRFQQNNRNTGRKELIISLSMAAEAQEALWKELNSKAGRLYQQGQYSLAAKVAEEALTVAERTFGPDHPRVAASLVNLAAVYEAQGRYAEAEFLYKRALGIVEKALGSDHPHVAATCENMAELYRQIGKEDEAKRLEERARKIRSNQ